MLADGVEHGEDTAWILAGMAEHDLRKKDLAAALGIAPSGISRLIAGTRRLKAQERITIEKLFSQGRKDIQTPASAPQDSASKTNRVPIYADPDRVALGRHRSGEDIVEFRWPPVSLSAAINAYGCFIPDERWAPMFLAGEVIFVHPGRPTTAGARVIARPTRGPVLLGRLRVSSGTRAIETPSGLQDLAQDTKVHLIVSVEAG
jgi:hypothetical protein